MRSKSLYLLVACICGSIAAVFASQWLNAQAGAGQGSTAEIFVAAVDLNVGDAITPERIRLEQWPTDKVPEGASGDLKNLEDKYAKQRVYAGEPIVPVKLMDENWEAVPKGFQTVGLSAAGINIARVIQPGDRVDVTAYFTKSDLIPRNIVKQVLMGVRVYSLDGDTERRAGEDRPKTVRSIELMIHKNDMEAWTWANELGKIRLSLGSDSDYSAADGSNEAGREFLAWLEQQRKRQEQSDTKLISDSKAKEPVVKERQKEEGFVMFKMVEGKMLKYLIVPGELPRLLGEVGGETNSPEELGEERDYEVNADGQEGDHSHLNGKDSPFYQPPVDSGPDYLKNQPPTATFLVPITFEHSVSFCQPLPVIDLLSRSTADLPRSTQNFRMDSKLVLQGSIAMELTRLTARIAAGLMIATAGMVIGSSSAKAQSGPTPS